MDLLIRPHLCAADWTDDCLGRALDTLYENGVTELFAIMAGLMVMALSLLVYALAERWVRQELKNRINPYLTKSENRRKTQHSDAFFKCLKALMSY